MNFTPKQLRDLIDGSKTELLRIQSRMEVYEMYVQSQAVACIPRIREGMKKDLERLQNNLKNIRDGHRSKLQFLEKVLIQDEEMNGWKGEDRLVELR